MPSTVGDAVGLVVAVLAGYLVGSLPLAWGIGRANGVDVERDGDGNPGSSNVWSLAGPRAGLLALTGDLAKGLGAAAAGWLVAGFGGAWLASLAAIAGHAGPLFPGRAGGRSVATTAGACLGLAPVPGVGALVLAGALAAALGRRGRITAIGAGFMAYPILHVAVVGELVRTAAVLAVLTAGVVNYLATDRRRSAGALGGRGRSIP